MGIARNVRGVIAAVRGDDRQRYRLAERVAQIIHPEAILSDRERLWLRDDEFRRDYFHYHDARFTTTMDRVFLLRELARLAATVEGDTAECGTYRGLSSTMICSMTQPGRTHHAFDSFEGLSNPRPEDGNDWAAGDLAATESEFRHNLAAFDVETYKGWIPERFDEVANRRFCLVHIDVDLYEPTLSSIEFFYDLVVPGGVIILDDYGFANCPGAKSAVDEFMADKPEPVLMMPTGTGVILRR